MTRMLGAFAAATLIRNAGERWASTTIARTAMPVLLASSAIASPALAGEAVLYQPAPAWVEASELPVNTAGPPVILYDDQRRIEAGVLAAYTDRAIRIDNPQMLQALGTLQASWMPDKGDLTVHAVDILRDGAVIDMLGQGTRFEVLRRETMLEQRTLDGARTAALTVPGLRVGDILRTRFTITMSDQALDQEVQLTVPLPAMPFEAKSARLLVSWPEDSDVAWKLVGAADVAQAETKGGYKTVSIALPLAKREEMPADAPVRYQMPPLFQAGTFDGWAEVSSIMAPLYATEGTIAADGPIARELANIEQAHEGKLERAVAALRLVQDEIAYQANGMDGGNYIPQKPAETWDMRFGDCKAKTMLLLAMLREMGIEAEAVTVASLTGDVVPTLLPMPGAFDHVIVRAMIEGRDYWLDGTSSGASPAVVDEVPPFHNALPIRASGAELIAMEQRPQTAFDQHAVLTFDHRPGLDVPTLWTGEWVLTGAAAAPFRGLIGQAGEEQIEQAVHAFSAQQVENSWILDSGLTYDEAANAVTVTVRGLIASPFTFERGRAVRGFALPSSAFEFRPDRSRKAWSEIPVALPGPWSQLSKVTLLLPQGALAGKGAAGWELDGRDAFAETIAGVKLAREANLSGDTLVITDSTSWPGGELAPERIAEERARASRFGSTELLLRGPTNALRSYDAASSDDRARFAPIESAYADLIAKDPDDPAIYGARAWFRSATLDRDGALADLDRIIALNANAETYIQRAGALLELGRMEQAEADAREAYALQPSLEAASVLARLLGETGRAEEAIALLDEQNVDAESRAGIAIAISDLEAQAGRKDAGFQRIDDMIARRPGDPALLNSRCWFQATWNYQPDQLEAVCTEAVERSDWSPPVLDSRAMGYYRLGRYADAMRDLDAALSANPDQTESLYLRGLVRLEMGDAAGRNDVEQALLRQPSLERTFKRWGIGVS